MSSFNVLRQSPRRVALASVLPERVHSLGTIGLRCRIHLRIEIESGWEPHRFGSILLFDQSGNGTPPAIADPATRIGN